MQPSDSISREPEHPARSRVTSCPWRVYQGASLLPMLRFAGLRLPRFVFAISVACAIACGAALNTAAADAASTSTPPRPEFMPAVALAPFVVKGRSLSVSILARTKGDRAYA